MNESTITKIALKTITDALEYSYGENNKYFPYYVNGVVEVTNALLKKERELKESNKATPNKPKKKFINF